MSHNRFRLKSINIRTVQLIAFAFLTAVSAYVAADDPRLQLNGDTGVSSAGFYSLNWQSDESELHTYILQESQDADFSQPVTLYEGPDTAYAMSGKSDGEYHYRVALMPAEGSAVEWSEPHKITVQHHSQLRAFSFFAIGAIIFTSTVVLIVTGARNTKQGHTTT